MLEFWPHSIELDSNVVDSKPCFAAGCRGRRKFGRCGPEFDRIRQRSARVRPNLDQTRTNAGDFGRKWLDFGKIWAAFRESAHSFRNAEACNILKVWRASREVTSNLVDPIQATNGETCRKQLQHLVLRQSAQVPWVRLGSWSGTSPNSVAEASGRRGRASATKSNCRRGIT